MKPSVKCGVFVTLACSVASAVATEVSLLLQKDYLSLTDNHALEVVYGALLGLGAGLALSVSGYLISQSCNNRKKETADGGSVFGEYGHSDSAPIDASDDESEFGDMHARTVLPSIIMAANQDQKIVLNERSPLMEQRPQQPFFDVTMQPSKGGNKKIDVKVSINF
ncbi:MAG: hypothetical protein NTV32_08570 [Gammaproteobacteria bacterium]|nr:hypothetical protein [Gammaproteobacteria bacterium]